MQHMHRIISVVALLPLLLAADSGSLGRVTPNPGGASSLLLGEGSIPKKTFIVAVIFVAKGPAGTTQYSAVRAAIDRRDKIWNGNLQLGTGRYDCWAVVIGVDPAHGTPWVVETNKQTVSVD